MELFPTPRSHSHLKGEKKENKKSNNPFPIRLDGAERRQRRDLRQAIEDHLLGLAAAGEDRLSALPDDVLVLILLRLHTAAAAARTSVLSRRWRRVWALLPELRFPLAPELARTRAVLESHEAALRHLLVGTLGASPDSVAAWLPAAARRLSGHLIFYNLARKEDGEGEAKGGAIELPCFGNATSVYLDLGLLDLAVPPAGVFARLTELSLLRVSFHGPWELGDAISSPRFPCLQKLRVHDCRGLNRLAINSASLLRVELSDLRRLRQLIIVAPALEELVVSHCFFYGWNQWDSISATQLVSLNWRAPYDPGSVDLGKMECVQWLSTFFFMVYGEDGLTHNYACLRLLERFKVVEGLTLILAYLQEIENLKYMMGDMTVLPDLKFLQMILWANGHAFGPSIFHVLRMCSGLRRLKLSFLPPTDPEAQSACQSGCICSQQPNWKTDELLLNRLEEVEIIDLRGSEHEIDFLKRLLSWAKLLKRITVTFDNSVSESMADELRQMLRSFSRPEICMKFNTHLDIFKALCEKEG